MYIKPRFSFADFIQPRNPGASSPAPAPMAPTMGTAIRGMFGGGAPAASPMQTIASRLGGGFRGAGNPMANMGAKAKATGLRRMIG